MATSPIFTGAPKSAVLQMIPAFGTRPRVLVTPGNSGCTITRIGISSNDAGANKVQFGIARKRTLAGAMGVGALVDGGGGSDTITRTGGSFLDDGWLAGKRFLLAGCTTVANDFDTILTNAAAGTLTFATATVNTGENLPQSAVIYEYLKSWYVDVAAGAGQPSVNGVAGIDTTFAPFFAIAAERELDLGPDDVLVAAVTTALSTGEIIDIIVNYADY